MNGQSSGLSPTTEVVLRYIQRKSDQPCTIAELAERLHCPPTVVNQVLKALLSAGKLSVARANGEIVYVAQHPR